MEICDPSDGATDILVPNAPGSTTNTTYSYNVSSQGSDLWNFCTDSDGEFCVNDDIFDEHLTKVQEGGVLYLIAGTGDSTESLGPYTPSGPSIFQPVLKVSSTNPNDSIFWTSWIFRRSVGETSFQGGLSNEPDMYYGSVITPRYYTSFAYANSGQ